MDLHLLKYLNIAKSSRAIDAAAPLWEEVLSLAQIRTWQKSLALDEFMETFAPFAHQSLAVGRLVQGASWVCLMAATIGDAVENRAKHYISDNQVFKGYIVDRIGSYLVERQVRELDKAVSREARDAGCRTTRRYSPGYRDFSIKAQFIFADLIGFAIPELRITSRALIKPEKTVTAFKAISEAGSDQFPVS